MAIAIAVVSCALLMGPILLFGAFTLRTSLLDLNARSARDREGTASLAATLVARGMAARSEQLRLLSTRDDVHDALTRRDAKRFIDIVAPMLAGLPDIASALAIGPSGELIARYPIDPAAQGQSFADRDYFAGALRTDGVFIGNAVTSRIDPDLVVVTLSTAIRDCPVVLRSMKADPATARVPVFVVSVEDDDGSARLLGAADHMTKPIDRERLRGWIASIEIGGGARARVAG